MALTLKADSGRLLSILLEALRAPLTATWVSLPRLINTFMKPIEACTELMKGELAQPVIRVNFSRLITAFLKAIEACTEMM